MNVSIRGLQGILIGMTRVFNNTKFCAILDDASRKILIAGRGIPDGGYR